MLVWVGEWKDDLPRTFSAYVITTCDWRLEVCVTMACHVLICLCVFLLLDSLATPSINFVQGYT